MSTQTHWLDHPKNIKRLWRGFLIVLALTLFAQLFVQVDAHFPVESIAGFSAWFGFLSCAAMIFVARLIALILKRPDTFYDEHHD